MYFLAQIFQEKLLRDTNAVRVLLSRSVLPVEVAASAVSAIDRETPLSDSSTAQGFLDWLAQAAQAETPRSSQVRENAGLVAATVLKQAGKSGPLTKLRLWSVVIPGGDLNGVERHDGLA